MKTFLKSFFITILTTTLLSSCAKSGNDDSEVTAKPAYGGATIVDVKKKKK
ncbi:MAG: hypothetical protein O3B09_03265 [Proteobacteria bacterium]|nr:hypothetical protein [Pseudomonadota bacterium]